MATPTPPKSTTRSLRLPAGLPDEITEAAEADGETFNGWIVKAVEQRLHPSVSVALGTLSLVDSAETVLSLADAEPMRFVDGGLLRRISTTLTAAAKSWPKR